MGKFYKYELDKTYKTYEKMLYKITWSVSAKEYKQELLKCPCPSLSTSPSKHPKVDFLNRYNVYNF